MSGPTERMLIAVFGATGALGQECVSQCLAAGHEVTVLARAPSKLDPAIRDRVRVIEGDGLDASAVRQTLDGNCAVLFAIGVDKASPQDLCTDVTAHILAAMPELGVERFVWCGGGGSTDVGEDRWTIGSRFVALYARLFMKKNSVDKTHQFALLTKHREVAWFGIRPLQMNPGPHRGEYRLGFDTYNGFSKITFADCADAMVGMLTGDEWLHRAPIIQY